MSDFSMIGVLIGIIIGQCIAAAILLVKDCIEDMRAARKGEKQ